MSPSWRATAVLAFPDVRNEFVAEWLGIRFSILSNSASSFHRSLSLLRWSSSDGTFRNVPLTHPFRRINVLQMSGTHPSWLMIRRQRCDRPPLPSVETNPCTRCIGAPTSSVCLRFATVGEQPVARFFSAATSLKPAVSSTVRSPRRPLRSTLHQLAFLELAQSSACAPSDDSSFASKAAIYCSSCFFFGHFCRAIR